MPSSMLPIEDMMVPPQVLTAASTYSDVFCNRRPIQRSIRLPRSEGAKRNLSFLISFLWPAIMVDDGVRAFLSVYPKPANVVILLQDTGGRNLITTATTLERVYWTGERYPRLDIKRTRAFNRLYGGNNLWGGFVLAIVPTQRRRTGTRIDPDAQWFLELVGAKGRTNA